MVNQKIARQVFDRDDNYCLICARTDSLVVHHRANRGMGGFKAAERASNYLTLCSSCNGWIEDNAWAANYALRRGIKVSKHNNLENLPNIPVADCEGQLWLLDDDFKRKRLQQIVIYDVTGGGEEAVAYHRVESRLQVFMVITEFLQDEGLKLLWNDESCEVHWCGCGYHCKAYEQRMMLHPDDEVKDMVTKFNNFFKDSDPEFNITLLDKIQY